MMGVLGMLGGDIDPAVWIAKVPCTVCAVEHASAVTAAKISADPDALAVIVPPRPAQTIAIGTPLCFEHAAWTLEAVGVRLPDALWLMGGLGHG